VWKAFESFKLPTIGEVKRNVYEAEYLCAIDMSSWFSQFGLSKEVRQFFCSQGPETWEAHTRLPMGFRGACIIAQRAAQILAHTASTKCRTLVYIDNILFSGTKEEVVAGLTCFVESAVAVGAQINEIPDPTSIDFDGLISTKVNFCGMVLDAANRSVTISNKTLSKIDDLAAVEGSEWTYRHTAAILSILLFSSRVLDRSLAERFRCFEIWRRFKPPQDHRLADEFWDSKIRLSALDRILIKDWIADIQQNPSSILSVPWEGQDPDLIAITDASKSHWAGITLDTSGGVTQTCGWSRCHSSASAVTEPWALYNTIMETTKESDSLKVLMLTDNKGLFYAVNKGFARAFSANRVVALLQKRRPQLRLRAVFVPGEQNLSNDLSRGQATSEESKKQFLQWAAASADLPAEVKRVIAGAGLPRLSIPYVLGKHTVSHSEPSQT
jgi:hypothetical protein